MQESLEIQPTPVQVISLFHYVGGFGWMAFLATLISIVVSLYILVSHLKFKWKRLLGDYHFRLRFLLALSLFTNRSCDLIKFLSIYYYDSLVEHLSRESENYALYRMPLPMSLYMEMRQTYQVISILADVSTYLGVSSLYSMMIFLLFLTLDRYQRIHMILPGTTKYYYFRGIVLLFSLALMFVYIAYGFQYVGVHVGISKLNPMMIQLIQYSTLLQLCFLSTGMLLYYYYTVQLIFTSIRGISFTCQNVFEAFKGKTWRKKPRQFDPQFARDIALQKIPPDGPIDDDDWVQNQVDIIQAQKIWVGIKMFSYLAIVLVIDLSIFAVMILVNTFDISRQNSIGLRHADVIAFVSSWIVFHVLIIYQLLDLFLNELKKAKFVQQVDEAKKDPERLKYLRRLLHFPSDTSFGPELVDLSLLPESNSVIETSGASKNASKMAFNVSPTTNNSLFESVSKLNNQEMQFTSFSS